MTDEELKGALPDIPSALEIITTLRAQLAEARAGELAWAETAKMHLKAEQAFLSWLRDAGEHLRTEGVTICDDGTDSGEVLAAKVAECVGLLKARADRAEAALAAQIEVDAEIADGFSDCQYRAIEMCVEAIRAQPNDRTALDRYREKVLREAAVACDWGDIYGDNAVRTILALIEKEKTK